MKNLSAKALRIAVKRHAPMSELLSEYQFENETDLCVAIHRIFTQKSVALGIISSLKKNEKKKVLNTPTSPEATSTETAVEEPEEFASEVLPPAESVAKDESLLDKLLAEEKTLSKELVALESHHKSLVAEHRVSKRKLERMHKILEELLRLMEEHKLNLSKELDKIQSTSSEMKNCTLEMNNVDAQLKAVRAKIASLKQVTIYVYETGFIDVENTEGKLPAPVFSDEYLNSKYMELIKWPRAKDYPVTLKDINTVANLLLLTAYLASDKISFEISFDSDEVQKFYEAVSTPATPA